VQSVRWNPSSATILATGGYDKQVCVVDCLQAQHSDATSPMGRGVVATYSTANVIDPLTKVSFSSDVEHMQWNPCNDNELFVGLENGYVMCFDRRLTTGFTRCFKAHDKTVCSLSFSRGVHNMLCTASTDKTVRIWDSATIAINKPTVIPNPPRCVAYKTMGVGKVLSCDYSYTNIEPEEGATANVGFLLACGGDGNDGSPAVWYSDELTELKSHFGTRNMISTPSTSTAEHTPATNASNNGNSNDVVNGQTEKKKKKKKQNKKSVATDDNSDDDN
jgi:WD40 repeat protein